MTNKEYEQRLERLEQEIAALRQETVEDESQMPPHPKPEIRKHQEYYYLASYGEVMYTKYDDADTEKMMRDLGNVFLTEKAAEYAAEYCRVLSDMREWAGNWDDPYSLAYNKLLAPGEKIQVINRRDYSPLGELRFACENDAVNCIKAVGKDRLLKYYFGVRDHEIPAETE